MSITFEQVQHAIELILQNQEKFTLQEVRIALGHRGSMSTISKYVQQWKNNHYISKKPLEKNMKPTPETLLESVTSLWQDMSDHSSKKLLEKEKETNEKISEYESKILELNKNLENEKSLNSNQEQLIKKLNEEKQKLETQLLIQQELCTTLKKDKESLFSQIHEFSDKNQQSFEIFKKELDENNKKLSKSYENQIKLLKEQISDLMNLNEEQRVHFIQLQDQLKEELKNLSVKKISLSHTESTEKTIRSIKQEQEDFLKAQELKFDKMCQGVQSYHWKNSWNFVKPMAQKET